MCVEELPMDLKATTTSTSGFTKGFTVKLSADGTPVGEFTVYRDDVDGFANSVEVYAPFRKQGYGLILLLLALNAASIHEIGFEQDSRGMTAGQEMVYAAAERKGYITTPVLGVTQLTGEGEAYLEDLGLI
jgi:hypothetical protein